MNWNRDRFGALLLTGFLVLPFLGWCAGGTGAEARSGTSYVLTLQHDHLSATIENLPLRVVLEKLSRLTDLEVSLEGSVGDESVSVEFKNLPLEEGIRRILQGKSYALTYAPIPSSSRNSALLKVVGIRVVSRGTGASPAKGDEKSATATLGGEIGERQGKSVQEPTRYALEDPDSKARAAALNTLKDQDDEAILTALRDEDPQAREAALEGIGEARRPVPTEILAGMALTDPSPALRMEALELLAEERGDTALDPLKQALRDPDPRVRGLAQGLLAGQRVSTQVLLEELKE